MEIKRLVWIPNLLLIAVCAFLTAKAVSAYLARDLGEKPEVRATNGDRPTTAPRRPRRENYDIIMSRNLFGVGRPAPTETAEVQPEDEIIETSLQARLIGTLVWHEVEKASTATIEDTSLRPPKTDLYRVGDPFLEMAKVFRIEREKVLLKFDDDGHIEKLSLYEEESLDDEKPKAHGASFRDRLLRQRAALKERRGRRPRPKDAQTRFTTGEIQSMASDIQQLRRSVSIRPSYDEEGAPNGYVFDRIKPGSLIDRAGLQNGDRVQSVNGIDVTNPRNFAQIFAEMQRVQKEGGTFDMKIIRNDRIENIRGSVEPE